MVKTAFREKRILLPGIMCVALLLNGGFFDESAAAIGVLVTAALLWMLVKGETFFGRDRRIVFLVPAALLGISVLVSFWAIDYMDNFLGVMRIGVVCLWMWLLRCRNKEEVADAKAVIPWMGAAVVLVSAASSPLPQLRSYFWENARMSGPFQYANTNALFLALGILQLVYHWGKQSGKKRRLIQAVLLAVLVTGLLLTGSRSVLLLMVIWGILYALRRTEFRKPFLAGTTMVLLIGGLYTILTGNTGNVGRIFTVFRSNSTLFGRFLYDRDAVLLLIKKFYGLGRMGYHYSQGTFQSGVYHVRFVHNDFLQTALDYGLPACILLLLFIVWQVFRGKQSRSDKEILLFLCAAALVDFHCQYLLIVMTACLFLDYGECEREKKRQLKENYVLLPIFILLFTYVGIATAGCRMGKPEITLAMLPDYTPAQEKKIVSCMGTPEAFELSTKLIQKNSYDITAYIARGSFYASQLCVPQCMEDLDRMLELDPYNVEYYVQYEMLLRNMQKQAVLHLENQEQAEQYNALLQKRIEELPQQLAKLQERTSFLAYKIKDKPVFFYQEDKTGTDSEGKAD